MDSLAVDKREASLRPVETVTFHLEMEGCKERPMNLSFTGRFQFRSGLVAKISAGVIIILGNYKDIIILGNLYLILW